VRRTCTGEETTSTYRQAARIRPSIDNDDWAPTASGVRRQSVTGWSSTKGRLARSAMSWPSSNFYTTKEALALPP